MSRPRRRPVPGRSATGAGLAAAVVAALLCGPGCTAYLSRGIDGEVAASPSRPWLAPARAVAPVTSPWRGHAELPRGRAASLAELLDHALASDPATREAYDRARAAAAALGSAKSAYYPEIDTSADFSYSRQTAGGGKFLFTSVSYGPSATLTYLLLDFGGRSGEIAAARQTLYAANFTHNAAIQDTLFNVEQAYYQLLGAKALVRATQASLDDAKQHLAAAEARRAAGVATLADVLQARTAVSQAMLSLQRAQGAAAAYHGNLATAVGVRPDAPLVVGELPENLSLQTSAETIDRLIARAEADRPDLRAARAEVEAAKGHVRAVRSELFPTLSVNANAGLPFYINGATSHGSNVGASLVVRFPLFDGFRRSYDLVQAREQEMATQAQSDRLAENVALQVWTSYQALQTATQSVKTARDLLTSAQKSEQVIAGRYQAGVGTILDLLTAQSSLASARAQEVQARADWLLAVAALAHDIGALAPGPRSPAAAHGKGQ